MRSQRYYIEHIQLPQVFYAQPRGVLSRLFKAGKDFLADCYNYVVDEDKDLVIPQSFTAEDFKAMTVTVKGGKGYALIIPPKPEETYDCELIGIANCGSYPVYRMIERMEDGHYCLCGWSPDGGHIFYGIFDDATSWEKKVEIMEDLLFQTAAA